MKSTGEVLGIGRTLNEALFKGLISAGFKVGHESTYHDNKYNGGVLISVHDKDKPEVISLAKKFADVVEDLFNAEHGQAYSVGRHQCRDYRGIQRRQARYRDARNRQN